MVKSSGNIRDQAENYYDDISQTYNQNMENSMKSITDTVLKDVNLPVNPVCLDIACGTGISTLMLAERCKGKATIYGIDLSEKMIQEANKTMQKQGLKNITYHKMDAENLKFPGSTFDFVLSNMALYLFPNKQKALSEVHRVLKPGGGFAFTYVAGPHYREEIDIFHSLASRHPEIPSFLKSVEDSRTHFISLEESVELFNSVGLSLSSIYGRHRLGWIEPDDLAGRNSQNVWWSLFRQNLLPGEVDLIGSEALEFVKPLLDSNGRLRITIYTIFANGKKP
jgi:ubiquinone/menaquinone biosynthesis C-methylase UbiE